MQFCRSLENIFKKLPFRLPCVRAAVRPSVRCGSRLEGVGAEGIVDGVAHGNELRASVRLSVRALHLDLLGKNWNIDCRAFEEEAVW